MRALLRIGLAAMLLAPGSGAGTGAPPVIAQDATADAAERVATPDVDRQGAGGSALPAGGELSSDLAAGGRHAYRVRLRAGELLAATAVQVGIDVAVTVFGPDGSILADTQRTIDGPEIALVVAADDGTHVLLVSAVLDECPAGGYRLRVDSPRAATKEDRLGAAATRLLDEAIGAWRESSAAATRRAIDLVDASLALPSRAGGAAARSEALGWRAGFEQVLGEWRRSIATLEEALELSRDAGDRHGEAAAHQRMALAHRRLGEVDAARAHLERAIALLPTGGDRMVEADIVNGLGVLEDSLGRRREALALFERSLPIYRAIGSRAGEGSTWHNIGAIHWALGERQASLEAFQRALALRFASGHMAGRARTLSNLGLLHSTSGEPQEAMRCYGEALAIWRRLGDRAGEASTLHNLGTVHADLGDTARALALLEQARAMRHDLEDRRGEGTTLGSLGALRAAEGRTAEGLADLERALLLQRETRNRQGEAAALRGVGLVHERAGRFDDALALYDEALTIERDLGARLEIAATLRRVATARAGRGDAPGARAAFEESLGLARDLRERHGEAEALYGLARIERDAGDLDAALRRAGESVDRVEAMRATVAADTLRASYMASRQDEYGLLVDILMRLHARDPAAGHDAEALATSERARARGLLDLLAASRAGIRRGVDPALLDREAALRMEINTREGYRTRLRAAAAPPAEIAGVEAEIDRLMREHNDLRAALAASDPRLASLADPRPLDPDAIRRDLLDPGTVLLEYALGEEASHLWVVSSAGLASHVLPPRAVIEAEARRLHGLLAGGPRRETEAATRLAAAALGRTLLAPAAADIAGRRLVIVPYGALHYVPFAALPDPAAADPVKAPPLVRGHEIVHLPSASVAPFLRRDRATAPPATGLVAVLADPVLEADDPRLPGRMARAAGDGPDGDLLRSVGETGLERLGRLRHTRREAEAIRAAAGGGRVLAALDFDASRETATSGALGGYRIVHFATHGLANARTPALSGIVLSMFDREGRPRDGFLRAHDLYDLDLGAELVVLSACRTALGGELRGEGLLGLVRGFMDAGAPRVVASLWDVRDEATAELMGRFYRGMLQDGMSPAAALRAAQLGMLAEPRFASPHAWAGFVLQGEWR